MQAKKAKITSEHEDTARLGHHGTKIRAVQKIRAVDHIEEIRAVVRSILILITIMITSCII